jgi:hypothetical protein
MSVYVGIDVHRKRSQVAVISEVGEVLANRNVPNGVKPVLSVIGELPPGTPAAYEAAFGWGWLLELLEGYGSGPHMVHPLQCKAIASARLKNDKAGAAILAQLLRADLLPEAGSRRRRCASCGPCCGTGPSLVRLRTPCSSPPAGWTRRCASGPRPARGSRCSPGSRAWGRSPRWSCSPRSATSPASARPQTRGLGRPHSHCSRQRPHRPPRAHLEAGTRLGAVGGVPGRADRQAAPGLRSRL